MSKEADYTDINLHKKYHQDLVFNYSEYPTKDHWSFDFTNNYNSTSWLGFKLARTTVYIRFINYTNGCSIR